CKTLACSPRRLPLLGHTLPQRCAGESWVRQDVDAVPSLDAAPGRSEGAEGEACAQKGEDDVYTAAEESLSRLISRCHAELHQLSLQERGEGSAAAAAVAGAAADETSAQDGAAEVEKAMLQAQVLESERRSSRQIAEALLDINLRLCQLEQCRDEENRLLEETQALHHLLDTHVRALASHERSQQADAAGPTRDLARLEAENDALMQRLSSLVDDVFGDDGVQDAAPRNRPDAAASGKRTKHQAGGKSRSGVRGAGAGDAAAAIGTGEASKGGGAGGIGEGRMEAEGQSVAQGREGEARGESIVERASQSLKVLLSEVMSRSLLDDPAARCYSESSN
ncbi:MAG: hypothetical protein ACPIOQ_27210, partial [Promethearchaeia archaeon]